MRMNEIIQFIRQVSGKVGSNIYAGVQGQTSPQHISFLKQLNRELEEKSSLDTPLSDLKVVVFDLETTGFFPEKGDEIISIGAVKITGSEFDEKEPPTTFYSLLRTDSLLTKELMELTNIHNEDIQTAPNSYEVLMQFFKFVKGRILVAHHASHELAFMRKITRELMKTKFEHRIIDTTFLIRLTDPSMKSPTLEEICFKYGVEMKDRHNALGDAKMAAQIWSYCIQKAQMMGMENLRDVYHFLANSK